MQAVRFGLIGYGNVGSMHADNLWKGRVTDATLAAVCDIDPEKRKKAADQFPGIKLYETHEALIASGEVDAVIVATPHYFHAPIAICALEHGLHALTEKPAGVRISDVKRMNAAAEKSGKVFGIMFNQRTNPLFKEARRLVQSGELGKPKRLSWIITNWYRTQNYYDSGAWRATWQGEGGGVLTNQAPHNLDIAQWIFGMPDRLRGFCHEGRYHKIAVEDFAMIHGEYDNGATMQFITTTGEYPGTNRLEIMGDGGKIVIEDGVLKLWKLGIPEEEYRFQGKEGQPPIPCTYSEYHPTEKETAHCGILNDFTSAILHGTPLLAPGVEGIHQATLTCAAYLSAWTNDVVELPFDEKLYDQLLEEKCKKEEAKQDVAPSEHGEGIHTRWSVKW